MRKLFLLLIGCLAVSVYAQSGESFVVGTLNNNTVYVGEHLIYTLRIHLLGEWAESQVIPPNLVGFGQSSLQLEPVVSTEVFGTDLYTIVEQNYFLFPLRIGTITIEPFQVQAPETPFHSGMTISTDPVTLTVLPLPPGSPTQPTQDADDPGETPQWPVFWPRMRSYGKEASVRCAHCAAEFPPRSARSRYGSRTCRAAAWRGKRKEGLARLEERLSVALAEVQALRRGHAHR